MRPAFVGDVHKTGRREEPSPVPGRVFWVLTWALPLLCIVFLSSYDGWPREVRHPEVDMSRRVVFGIASVLELYGAAMIGFALGAAALLAPLAVRREMSARALLFRRRNVVLTIVGVLLILVGGHFEYLALTDRIP